MLDQLLQAIKECSELPPEQRIEVFNAATTALRVMVADIAYDDPVLGVQLVPAKSLHANDYNPNHVAHPEMDLLEQSIRCDGVTMPVVTVSDGRGGWIVVDGFHRRSVLCHRLGRRYIPCSVIDKSLADRMASTIRHNRARGKHGTDLIAELVRSLIELGWDNPAIATHLGMTEEELLRLMQMVGVAPILAASEYSKSWGTRDEPNLADPESE